MRPASACAFSFVSDCPSAFVAARIRSAFRPRPAIAPAVLWHQLSMSRQEVFRMNSRLRREGAKPMHRLTPRVMRLTRLRPSTPEH